MPAVSVASARKASCEEDLLRSKSQVFVYTPNANKHLGSPLVRLVVVQFHNDLAYAGTLNSTLQGVDRVFIARTLPWQGERMPLCLTAHPFPSFRACRGSHLLSHYPAGSNHKCNDQTQTMFWAQSRFFLQQSSSHDVPSSVLDPLRARVPERSPAAVRGAVSQQCRLHVRV